MKRGRLWRGEEDNILIHYVTSHGLGHWNLIPRRTGLKRCGKSCRLRWINYLSPTVNRARFTHEEEDLILRLHKLLGNRWSLIAKRVPGRTDNQVKNHWNTHLSKKKLVHPPIVVSSSTPTLSQAAAAETESNLKNYTTTQSDAVKESQNSNAVDKTRDLVVEEENCIKSFWDYDHHQITALDMAELLQGYPTPQPLCINYHS